MTKTTEIYARFEVFEEQLAHCYFLKTIHCRSSTVWLRLSGCSADPNEIPGGIMVSGAEMSGSDRGFQR